MSAIPILLLIILIAIICIIFKQMFKSNPSKLRKADAEYINSKMQEQEIKPDETQEPNTKAD